MLIIWDEWIKDYENDEDADNMMMVDATWLKSDAPIDVVGMTAKPQQSHFVLHSHNKQRRIVQCKHHVQFSRKIQPASPT